MAVDLGQELFDDGHGDITALVLEQVLGQAQVQLKALATTCRFAEAFLKSSHCRRQIVRQRFRAAARYLGRRLAAHHGYGATWRSRRPQGSRFAVGKLELDHLRATLQQQRALRSDCGLCWLGTETPRAPAT